MDDDLWDSMKKQAGWAENRRDKSLLREVGQLCSGKVGGLEAVVAFVLQMMEDEIDEISVDSGGRDSKAFLRLCFLSPRSLWALHKGSLSFTGSRRWS